MAVRIRLREAFGVTSPSTSRSGLDRARAEDRAERPPSEAESEASDRDRVRRRLVLVRDSLRDWGRERFVAGLGSGLGLGLAPAGSSY